jgi:serine/threonine-protein kinase ATR
LKAHPEALKQKIMEMPQIADLPGLGEALRSQLQRLRKPLGRREMLGLFALRLTHEHSGVVLKALQQLAKYLRTKEDELTQTSAEPDPVAATLLRALLDCAAKYNGANEEIGCLVAECIGYLGCVDSNRVDSPRSERTFLALHNFREKEESTDFVLFMLEEVLIKAFFSEFDVRLPQYAGYAMQQLLEVSDVRAACAMQGAGVQGGMDIYHKWLDLSDTAREVLTPFLSGRFALEPLKHFNIVYPIFRPEKSYGHWLKLVSLYLLQNGQSAPAQMIFEPLRRVIRIRDLSVAEFLLPYLFVHAVASDWQTPPQTTAALVEEFVQILSYRPRDDASAVERGDAKRLYGVS